LKDFFKSFQRHLLPYFKLIVKKVS